MCDECAQLTLQSDEQMAALEAQVQAEIAAKKQQLLAEFQEKEKKLEQEKQKETNRLKNKYANLKFLTDIFAPSKEKIQNDFMVCVGANGGRCKICDSYLSVLLFIL
jgi:hypothetical protein